MEEKTLNPVHLLSVGRFGEGVGWYLKQIRRDVVETALTADKMPMPQMWPASRIHLLASWRPVPAICELLSDLSYEWRRPFVPIMLDSTAMRLGPVILPGNGSCWRCWVQRSRQHARWPEEQSVLLEHYGAHAEAGPQGYLEAFAMMAAVRLSQTIDELDSGIAIGGYIWKIDMMTREIITSTVVAIHDCPYCGLHRPPLTRSFAEIEPEIGYLWRHDKVNQQ